MNGQRMAARVWDALTADGGAAASDFRDFMHKLHEQYRTNYPDEPGISNIAYMESEFGRQHGAVLPWTFDAIAKGNVTTKIGAPQRPYTSTTHGCFYNALGYAQTHPDVDLAFGVVIDAKKWQERLDSNRNPQMNPYTHSPYNVSNPLDTTLHAFCIAKNGSVIDPTLGTSWRGNFYVYEKVPRELASSWKIKANDKNYDARHFGDYVDGRTEQSAKRFDFVKFMSDK